MGNWNSNQYMKFGNERTQPSQDLISRLKINPKSILDIGCGPGNSTNALAERFCDAHIIGIDSSQNMLDSANAAYPRLDFRKCRIPDELDCIDGKFDLVFSNACIQWIPNHDRLLSALMNKLTEGGMLAVQIPMTQEAPFYKILTDTVVHGKWEKLKKVRDFYNLVPEQYYDLLCDISSSFDIWHTTYFHTVNGEDGVLDWYRGSGLRPYLDALDETERDEFLAVLRKRIEIQYPIRRNRKVILKMPRLFFTALK